VKFIVAIKLMVDWTHLEHLCLERDTDGDRLFFPLHTLHARAGTMTFAVRCCLYGGAHSITLMARRQAAACGAGSGGS
jgi:hypothetical protein